MSFSLGDEFDSYEEFLLVKEEFESKYFINMSKEKSALLKKVEPSVSEKLVYSRITFACKYGVKRTPSKSKGLRRVATLKQGCPFVLELRARKLKFEYKLCVMKFNPNHNDHPMDEHTFRNLPKQRRLDDSITAEVKTALKFNLSPKQLHEYIRQKTGRAVSMKDLRNLLLKVKRTEKTEVISTDGNVMVMIDAMKDVPGAVIQIGVTDSNELVGVFFQDRRMSVLCKSFPEIMVYDASYKLEGDQLFTLLVLVVDGNGDLQVGCVWVSTSESADSFEAFAKIYKDHNSSWSNVEVIMGELDFAGRQVFKESFPNAHLSACQFHVYKTFCREITTKNLVSCPSERENFQLLMKQLMLASSNEKYEEIYSNLQQSTSPAIFEYYTNRWHETRDGWCSYLNNNFFNQGVVGEECVNHKLRKSMSRKRFPDLRQFFIELMLAIQSAGAERNLRLNMRLQKFLVVSNKDGVPMPTEYRNQLTWFAYGKLKSEFEKSVEICFESVSEVSGSCKVDDVTVTVTSSKCDCKFNTAFKLPCAHVFAFRKIQRLPVFDAEHIVRRWSKAFWREVSIEIEGSDQGLDLLTNSQSKVDRSSQIRTHTSQIESCLVDLPSHQYEFYLEKLKQFANFVTEKKRFTILTMGGNVEVVNCQSRDGSLKSL